MASLPISYQASVNRLRSHAMQCFVSSLKAGSAKTCLQKFVIANPMGEGLQLIVNGQVLQLARFNRVLIVGAGTAAVPMAAALEQAIGELKVFDLNVTGHIITEHGHAMGHGLKHVTVSEGSSPLPNQAGVDGTRRLMDVLTSTPLDAKCVVFILLSAGCNALLCQPVPGVSLTDLNSAYTRLLGCGAGSKEVNCVMKHLSSIQGGRLATMCEGAGHVFSLALSISVGKKKNEDMASLDGGGPTVCDPSTLEDCVAVLDKYKTLRNELPASVLHALRPLDKQEEKDHSNALKGGSVQTVFLRETPKASHPVYHPEFPSLKLNNIVLGNNEPCIKAVTEQAKALGYNVLVLSSRLEGEAKHVAVTLAAVAEEIVASNRPLKLPACVIMAGRTTILRKLDVNAHLPSGCVRIFEETTGQQRTVVSTAGSNQEMALAAALAIDKLNPYSRHFVSEYTHCGIAVLCAATSGIDGSVGPNDGNGAAGALVDSSTCQRGRVVEAFRSQQQGGGRAEMGAESMLESHESGRYFSALDETDAVIEGMSEADKRAVGLIRPYIPVEVHQMLLPVLREICTLNANIQAELAQRGVAVTVNSLSREQMEDLFVAHVDISGLPSMQKGAAKPIAKAPISQPEIDGSSKVAPPLSLKQDADFRRKVSLAFKAKSPFPPPGGPRLSIGKPAVSSMPISSEAEQSFAQYDQYDEMTMASELSSPPSSNCSVDSNISSSSNSSNSDSVKQVNTASASTSHQRGASLMSWNSGSPIYSTGGPSPDFKRGVSLGPLIRHERGMSVAQSMALKINKPDDNALSAHSPSISSSFAPAPNTAANNNSNSNNNPEFDFSGYNPCSLVTGPTGSNSLDLCIMLISKVD